MLSNGNAVEILRSIEGKELKNSSYNALDISETI